MGVNESLVNAYFVMGSRLYMKSGSRRRNFLKQVIAMLVGDEIVPPRRKWYKVAKRIIEIIALSGLHLDKK